MTSNEITNRDDDGTLEVFPPAQAPNNTAIAMLHQHARAMDEAHRLASAMVRTTVCPARYAGKAGDATAAILYGAELGLTPIQSLQRVVAIHGMPTLEARTMVGLLKSRGYKVRTVEQSDTSVTVEGEAPDGETASSTWTIARATQAGYVPTMDDRTGRYRTNERGKLIGNEKYLTDPQAMLKAKAQAEVCRELAPDVLMGISYSREDLESERQDQFDRPEPAAAAPRQPVTVDEIFADEVPLDEPKSSEDPDNPTGNPRPAAEQAAAGVAPGNKPYVEAAATAATAFPETPAGDVTEDQGDAAPEPAPSPAAQNPADTEDVDPAVELEAAKERAKQAAIDHQAAVRSKTIAAKRDTAPAADPDRPKSRMRKALEKRLFALLGDAGLGDEQNRDGRLALYSAVLERPGITSTDELDDAAVGKVADVLYQWQEQNVLEGEVAAILADAAREPEADATAPAPTSEGNQ